MSKSIYLLRHGEAGFSDGIDFERNLTSRGVEQLSRMVSELSSRISHLDFVLCSSAHRTRQTLEVLREKIGIKELQYERIIYEGKLSDYIGLLEQLPVSVDSCLIVGHNPIISILFSHLTGDSYQNMAPGTFVELDVHVNDWAHLGFETCSTSGVNY